MDYEEHKRVRRQKWVISGILSSFILVMTFTRPWEYRTEILGSIILPQFDKNIILQKPDEVKKYLKKQNATPVKVLVNRKLGKNVVTLETLGVHITSPQLDERSGLLVYLGNLIAPEADSPITAQVELNHQELESYLDSIRPNVEVEAQKPEIEWTEQRGWKIKPMRMGTRIDEKAVATGMSKLFSNLTEGNKELTLDLKTKKVGVKLTSDERQAFYGTWGKIQTLVEKPLTLVMSKDDKKTLDLNSDKNYITLNDEGAELNEGVLRNWAQDLATQYAQPAGDVRITGKNEIRPGVWKAVTEGDFKHGKEIKVDELISDIETALQTSEKIVQVHIDDVPFRVYSELEQTPYSLLSVGFSEYSTGNHDDRVTNFTEGLRRVSETLVDKGQEISFNKPLGKFDEGFVMGLGIMGTTAAPVIGGGICQASTTFYRALLNLGVPITMKKNHSWDLSYYRKGGYGLDATIFPEQGLDVKGINDIDSQLYIHAYTKPETLEAFVLIYGKGDGRKVTLRPNKPDLKFVSGPKTIRWTQIIELPSGEVKQNEIVSVYAK